MADYRLSAQIISRSAGRSSVAAAAYRSGTQLQEERTGELHDYTRKQGVVHCEILTPTVAPDWMHDRAQLWNAVEKMERRKDAQLCREIQLSLPHELNDDQRHDLTRRFVQDQFVSKGMVADLAIHAPHRNGDERNHHAHILLSLREVHADGFAAKKNRDWNSTPQLKVWREQWARYQNREFERLGLSVRVDHRSYEDQGIDREASQHLGPTAHDMEQRGKRSERGDLNRAIQQRNSVRAAFHREAVAVQLAAERESQRKLDDWKQRKRDELADAQLLADLDLDRKHHAQRVRLEDRLTALYGEHKTTLQAELNGIERRLRQGRAIRVLREVFGRNRSDSEAKDTYLMTLRDIERREQEQRQTLNKQQALEQRQEQQRQGRRREWKEHGLDKAQPQSHYKNAPRREHWKVRKTDLLPTDKQAALLQKHGLDPARFNRVGAAREIDKIAQARGWKKPPLTRQKPEPRPDRDWKKPPAQAAPPEPTGALSRLWKQNQTGSNDNNAPEPSRAAWRSRDRKPEP